MAFAAVLAISPLAAHGQSETLTITNGVQKYAALWLYGQFELG